MWSFALPQRFRQWLQPGRVSAIVEACLIGLVAALSAVLLKVGSGWLGAWRVHVSLLFPAWLVLPAIGLSFGFLAGLLIEQLAPEATGSGIPHVKAVLANVPLELSWRVASVKLVTAILALGSGLTLGRSDGEVSCMFPDDACGSIVAPPPADRARASAADATAARSAAGVPR